MYVPNNSLTDLKPTNDASMTIEGKLLKQKQKLCVYETLKSIIHTQHKTNLLDKRNVYK